MSFAKAIQNAQPGDLYWMLVGTYTGTVSLSNNGTAVNPMVPAPIREAVQPSMAACF